jgi:hypothetical protein
MKDDLIKAAEHMSDKGYELSTLEKQAEFAQKRNIPTDYDVVIDTLQQKRDALWKMTQQNMNADMDNIMDQIRLEQIAQLERAIELWHWRDDGK